MQTGRMKNRRVITEMKNRRVISDLIFLIIILFLAFASYISYQRITKQNQASNLVAHANLVKFKLGQTLSQLRLAEKQEQDSIHTRNGFFNLLLSRDSSQAFQMMLLLDSLTGGDKDQHFKILQLKSILEKWLDNLHSEYVTAENFSADLSNYSSQGQALLNRIQMLFIEMRHIEDDLLLQKIQEKDRSAFLLPLFSLVFSFVAIFLVSGTYYRLRSETRLRMKAEDGQAVIHNFFQQVPAMMAILKGPDHVFEFVNQPYLELIGGRNPINRTVKEAIPEVAGQGYYEILDSVYKTGKPFIGKEMPVELDRGKGVEKLYINFINQVFKNAAGKTEGILIFCYDVSEQVIARRQLEEAESRSRLAIDAARMGTFDWDLQNQNFISSERLVEIFGYQNAAQVTHQDLINRFHPDDKHIRDEAVQNSFISGSLKYEIRIIWPDKSIHWINVYGKILTDDTRNVLRMYGTAIDITPQILALEEIKESEAKFRFLANAMPQQIWTADKNGKLDYFNQAVFDYSGKSREDLLSDGWLSIVHPDEQKQNMIRWSASIKSGREFILEHRFRNFNGEYRWQLSRAIPQKDDRGNIQMWIGTSTDIQEQKHFMQELEKKVFERTQSLNYANLALKQTVSEMEQTNAELASFNYIASHDLQEPLRKIIAFSKHIGELEKDSLALSSRDYFDRIINAASRMQNLIDAFLSYSQTSNIRASLEKTDFNQVYNEVINDFAEVIEKENIVIDCPPLPSFMAIPLQINQLFTNLIGNAIKYRRPGGNHKIEVFSEEISGKELLFEGVNIDQLYRKISISDNGIGFDPIHEIQIFELFQRLHSRQEYAGTGIGLAICKKIMRNHQGFISATGVIGSGAIFSMYFPISSES
jgi:PAS domain S-box-containing protein